MIGIFASVIFIIGYFLIATEEKNGINKTATALITGLGLWIFISLAGNIGDLNHQLLHHFQEIAQLLFFLLGAMTIVEFIDSYEGFDVITNKITTKSPVIFSWIICMMTFFLSSVLDNLTTAIVMTALVQKMIPNTKGQMLLASMVILAANAGGAWSPIGDVTTTMLWIRELISTEKLVLWVFIPSIVSIVVPMLLMTKTIKNVITLKDSEKHTITRDQIVILVCGIGGLISVPIIKTVTHLPPFMGMLFVLGILWFISEKIDPNKDQEIGENKEKGIINALRRIDTPSILFFIGILMAVAALQTLGTLSLAGTALDNVVGDHSIIAVLIGFLSAIVDNVPIVAAAMDMYKLPTDNIFWHFVAYTAGTGGSMLIIGSAAGVTVMGLIKNENNHPVITFGWYLKKIAPIALIGYLAGCAVFYLQTLL